jgi:glycosyltransferase involved in cell wall biosynthesis
VCPAPKGALHGNVLFLTPAPPLPATTGARIRNLNLMRQLREQGWNVSLFTLAPPAELRRGPPSELASLCSSLLIAPTPSPARQRLAMLGNLASGVAYHASYGRSVESRAAVGDHLARSGYDCVVLSQLFMYDLLPERYRGITLFDSHNAELFRMESLARQSAWRFRTAAARLQKAAVGRLENEATRSLARTLAVSDREAAYFELIAPGRVDLVPNGIDVEHILPRQHHPSEPTILFIGSLNYSANIDAVTHLVDDVLPHIGCRQAHLDIVGSNPPPSLARVARRATLSASVTANVPTAKPYFENCRLLAVPLRIGGGTRLKILEALAYGTPVVSTTLGCEGLDVRSERDLLIADEPRQFAAAIDRLLTDDALCERLSLNGRRLVEQRYDWRVIGKKFGESVSRVLDR